MKRVTGVYELNTGADSLLVVGEDNEGQLYGEVPFRRVSNPIDGLPESLWLRFTDEDQARIMADRPNAPVQITVEYYDRKDLTR